ncbi:hypothetical protein GCM10023169_36130 [Georgenia halophila]|uniref:ORC1/DEAH AAA+ ATPase domain-containing protein n=1 Tax=Georgenia halophila TaxID=620889 RepID=A0ABP8LNK4_9MICO
MTERAKLPGKVATLLRAPANVALHGSPGSGKSFISDKVVGLLTTDPTTSVIRVDLSTTMSGAAVFEEVRRQLEPDTAAASYESSNVHVEWRGIRAGLMGFQGHVVLVLDQFDRVLRFGDGQEFLLLLRELVHRPESICCTALVGSRRSLQAIEAGVRGISTLASVFYTEFLGSARLEDLSALGPGAKGLSIRKRHECLEWSGGHPALAKYWLSTRPDRQPDPASELERIRTVLRVLDHLADVDLVDAAAQTVLGPVIDEFLFERQELQLLGVLPSSASDQPVEETLAGQGTFRDALRMRTRSMNPWGVLGAAEVQLRGIVDIVMRDAYGQVWADEMAKRHSGIRRLKDEATEKLERDERSFGRSSPWLSYTYPGDLWTIVQAEWAVFEPVFNTRDKAYWRTIIVGLAQYRAPLAHGRPEVLSEEQRTQCRIFAEKIIERLRAFQADTR